MERSKLNYLLFFPASIVYLELFTKLLCFGELTVQGAVITLIFSLAAGALLAGICALFRERSFAAAIMAFSFALCAFFAVQNVYFSIFGTFFSFASTAGAGAALHEFGQQAIIGMSKAWKSVAVLFLPFAASIVFRKHFSPLESGAKKIFISCLLLHISALCCVFIQPDGVISPKYLYTAGYMPELSVRTFGAVTTGRLDIQQLISPPKAVVVPAPTPEPTPAPTPTPTVSTTPETIPVATPEPIKPNVLDIDFTSLIDNAGNDKIKKMHEYFASQEPTMQNDYTGFFEGKNLIWIVAEGFSDIAVDETHTPTLHKLINSGFVFNNFYNPVWGVSTSDGEYVTLTGLLPKSGVWSFTKSANNYMGTSMGHILSAEGYLCKAYHNHTYTYYNRHLSHPNMGYDYIGVGNGLEMENVWPRSDLEMMQKTVADYIGADTFHTYYLTVSGHMYYTIDGNYQAWKHIDDVADLPYSSNCRAYIACNMELDLAIENLISQLEEAGKLDDTVIVLSADHYPYGLTRQEISELRGYDVEQNFEIYRSGLIIWNSAMEETIEVNKPCSSVDILPTLCNLFGLDYDSRLLIGRDIFSDCEGFVYFANRSFISEHGRYDSTRDKFTPTEGVEVPENYARDMLYGRVSNAFSYSAAILDNDYYSVVLPKENGNTVVN